MDGYTPEPELTADERAALASIRRRRDRATAAKELAQHKPTWGPVLMIDKEKGDVMLVPGSDPV